MPHGEKMKRRERDEASGERRSEEHNMNVQRLSNTYILKRRRKNILKQEQEVLAGIGNERAVAV